jgi:hypothetical protein
MSANWSLTRANNGMLVQDNPWGALNERYQRDDWELTITKNVIAEAYFDFPAYDPRYVLAYPSMIYGSKFGTTPDTSDGQLPKRAGDCDFHIDFKWDMTAKDDAVYNVAIETFFHSGLPITGPGHPSGESNKKFELMVWLARPSDSSMYFGRKVGTFEQGSAVWEIYRWTNREDYIAFIPPVGANPYKMGTIHWRPFIVETQRHFQTNLLSMQMSALELGPEIWGGTGVFYWDTFLVTPSAVDQVETMTEEAAKCGLTKDQAHRLSLHHHGLSVSHNGIAKIYEEIRDENFDGD